MSSTADQIQQMVRQALRRFDELAASDLPMATVVAEMADLVCRTIAGLGSVVWLPADRAGSSFRASARSGHLASLAIGEQARPIPQVEQAIRQVLEQHRSAVVAPDQAEFASTELQRTTQFYLPIDAAGRFSGTLHLICSAELDPKLYRQYVAFAQQGARALGIYLARRQTELLQADAASAERILRLTRHLAATRRPDDAIHELANQSRQTLEAHRAAAVGFRRGKPHVAFSDTVQINHRAVLVRTVELLADLVRQREAPMTFLRDQPLHEDDLALSPLLTQLWELGGARVVCLTPIRGKDRILGALIVEYDDADSAGRRAPLQQTICQHAGPLIQQAAEWHHRPLRRTSNLLAAIRSKPLASSLKAAVALALIAAAVYLLFLMPVPIHLWADARLEPALMQTATSPMNGRVDRVLVTTGQKVQPGDPLLQMDTADLHFARAEVLAEQQTARLELDTQLASQERPERAAEVASARLQLEHAGARLRQIDRQIERATVRAAIAGTVLTERPQRVESQNLSEGDEVLTIADLSLYDLVLELPEEDLALLQDTLAAGRQVPVDFIVRPFPDLTLRAVISDPRQVWPTSVPDERQSQHVFRIVIPFQPHERVAIAAMANPTGRAKLTTDPGSVAFRYARGVWRFIKLKLLF